MQYDGKQIMTAKSQIQVHNRFHLKETTKLSQTIDFLVTMTKVIQSTLKHQDLHIIPPRHLSRSTFSALQSHLKRSQPGTTYLTSFEAYQNLNDKNASRTLKVAFGRMLLSVKGMSAERVSAILDTWETPRDIWDALQIRNQEPESIGEGEMQGKKKKVRGPELYFADTVQGEGRRKVGDALSKEVSTLTQEKRRLICSCIEYSWVPRQRPLND
jgi:crossover junction endonuclease MUS81